METFIEAYNEGKKDCTIRTRRKYTLDDTMTKKYHTTISSKYA